MKYIEYIDNSLHINGINLSSLSDVTTPALLFFPTRLSDNVRVLREASPDRFLSIHYAFKANYHPLVSKILLSAGCGVEVMTGEELTLALSLGFSPKNIIFNGVGRTDAVLRHAVSTEINAIVVDNPCELSRLSKVCEQSGMQARVFFRFYPFFSSALRLPVFIPDGYKLGIQSFSELNAMLDLVKKSPLLKVTGLSFHVAVRARTSSLFIEALKSLISPNLLTQFPDADTLSVGGGFDSRFFLERSGNGVESFFAPLIDSVRSHPRFRRLVVEPGRFLINDCFTGLSTAITSKEAAGETWHILDIGTNVLIPRPNAHFEVFPLIRKSSKLHTASFADGICSKNSVIARRLLLPHLEPGDRVAILNCGAYTINMASTFGYAIPPVLVMENNTESMNTKISI
ncbi:MAG: hypothetical protein PHQ23_14985 [Candidatus Wallbacteria bacterium]|nr:hypothetical protein [Candidatus Wallbacteria bacterium]